MYDQAVFVATNVKTYPIVLKNAGIAIISLHVRRSGPICRRNHLVPGLQGLFGVSIAGLFPKRRNVFLEMILMR